MKFKVKEHQLVKFESVEECKQRVQEVLSNWENVYNVNLMVQDRDDANVVLIDKNDIYNQYPELIFCSVDNLSEVELFLAQGEKGLYVFSSNSEASNPKEKMVEYSPLINGMFEVLDENKVYEDILNSIKNDDTFELTYL